MMSTLRGRVSKLASSNIFNFLPYNSLYDQLLSRSRSVVVPSLMGSRLFSSIDSARSPYLRINKSAGTAVSDKDDGRYKDEGRIYSQNPPDPIPNRPLRGVKTNYPSENYSQKKIDLGGKNQFGDQKKSYANNKPTPRVVGENKTGRPSGRNFFPFDDDFGNNGGGDKKLNTNSQTSRLQSFAAQKEDDDFLEKFKLGFDKEEKTLANAAAAQVHRGEDTSQSQAMPEPPAPPPHDADEMFKKMKETGLIPNAVAMLDGLCKDGLVQEAMKLFGLMREKGTIPEVVIYTAVVEGFCKAQKLDDAKRIFRKMQSNGISPNAFSYAVLIQGLYRAKMLEDALEFCLEMLESGHSLNLATFTGLIDGFCREKGVEEAQSIVGTLRQKGFFYDEKPVREYLDKKGPFLPLVWEAILGKKSPQRSF